MAGFFFARAGVRPIIFLKEVLDYQVRLRLRLRRRRRLRVRVRISVRVTIIFLKEVLDYQGRATPSSTTSSP